ncbi:MAG: sugar ABC transporter permease [Clostridiales bacterium]|nr:sugar ABC transporter permease [Clostridiales bacterium]
MKTNKRQRKENMWLLAFAAPALILFSVFVVYPFFMGINYSFYDWDGVSPERIFVGLKNYASLFKSKYFVNAMLFTIKFTVVTVITQNLGALIIANLLDNTRKCKNFLRGVFFVPNVLSGVIVAFIWSFIFTKVLPSLGMKLSWFSQADTAFWATVIVAFWLGTGYLTVVYLAGLSTVDTNIIEAALIDGANPWQMLFKIKTPLIMPSIIIGIFLVTMNGLKQFEIVFLMTSGGPYRSTETLALLSYNTAYAKHNFGQATAQAVVLFILVAVVTLIQLVVLKDKEVES